MICWAPFCPNFLYPAAGVATYKPQSAGDCCRERARGSEDFDRRPPLVCEPRRLLTFFLH